VLLDLGVAAKDTEVILAGTPTYFAPEVAAQFAQVETSYPVGLGADVFALALTLRNALEPETQEEVAGSAIEAFIEHRARHVPRPPRGKDLKFLEPHFRRWLALDPAERPTAAELVRELAVLTAPEERRERRNKTLRWLVPLVLAAATVFASAVFALKREAQRNEERARLAERETEEVRGDLSVAQARQQALSDDLSEARRRIQAENLNREQMETALARERATSARLGDAVDAAEARARELRARLEAESGRAARLEMELGATREERDRLLARATGLEQDLARTRRDLGAREDELRGARSDVERLGREVDEVRGRAASLAAQLEETRRQAEQARAAAAQADARAAEAAAERGRVEADLAELRREVAQLRARLAQAQAASGGGSVATPTDPGASAGGSGGVVVTPAPGVTPATPTVVGPQTTPLTPLPRRLQPPRLRQPPAP
jgi:predicted  nucleic acid-binding Zn-ribbon protein